MSLSIFLLAHQDCCSLLLTRLPLLLPETRHEPSHSLLLIPPELGPPTPLLTLYPTQMGFHAGLGSPSSLHHCCLSA